MKNYLLARAVGHIDDKYIKEAEYDPETAKPDESKRAVWLRFGAVAAAACIIAAVGIGMNSVFKKLDPATPPVDTGTPGYSFETESQTEAQTESETEDPNGKGGAAINCKHTGNTTPYDGWNDEFHVIRNRLVYYVGFDDADAWFKEKHREGGFDGIGEGSRLNLYDYIHTFNIPKEIVEIEYIYSYEGYYSVLTQEVIDMIYEDRAEDFENFFLNLGPRGGLGFRGGENYQRVGRMWFEVNFLQRLIGYENRHNSINAEAFRKVRDEVLSKFDEDYFRGQYPDNVGIYSIPEAIYLNGLTKEEVKTIYYSIYSPYWAKHYKYDFDSIFNEREKYEKLIADARAMEDPMDMLRATRAINEMIRK